jgi:signal transduction histidine kinase
VVESEPVPLAGIVETCWIDLGLSASAATLDCGPLPTVHANPTRMRQVFLNLLQNAVKFAHPERAPAVTIRCEEEQGLWKVFVSDNGVGIPAGFEQVIFAPFRRLDPQRPGSGIGLALVRRIVEGLGGQAVAERVPDGRGATFSVTLPAVS